MDLQDSVFSNPLLLRLVMGYIQTSHSQLSEEALKQHLVDAGFDPRTAKQLLEAVDDESALLPRQPDPEPPAPVKREPSLLLYFVLLAAAGFLVAGSFFIQEPNWAGLSANLATEIVGAVIILILVERRLRSSELRTIREQAESYSIQIATVFSPEIRDTVNYTKALNAELQRIRPTPYIDRREFENLLKTYQEGLLLHGEPGIGKSTLLQTMSIRQTERLLRSPKSERIPILFPMRQWTDDDASDQLWKQVRQYSELSWKRFVQWLERGRLIVIFDGLNECSHVDHAVKEIQNFMERYPDTMVIVSVRTVALDRIEQELSLTTVEVPGLSQEEAQRFLHLSRQANH